MSKLLTWGIYLLALIMPLQTRYIFKYGELNNGPWTYGDISLYGLDILIIVLAILTLINHYLPKLKYPKYLLWIPGILIASILSITMAVDPLLASFALVKLLAGIIVFLIILTQKYDNFKFWLFFLAGASIQSIVAVWQFLNQGNLANKWLGLAEHTAKTLGTCVVEAEGATGIWERWLRAYGTLDHPNVLGGLLAISILIAIILKIRKHQELTNRTSLLLLSYITVMSAGLFVSFSRAAWLALIIGLIVLMIQNFKQWRTWLISIIIILSVFGVLMAQYHYLALSRFGDLHRIEVTSVNERLDYTTQAKELVQEYWPTGVGIGNYGLSAQRLDDRQVSYWYQPVHNTWLLVFAELGIVGIISLLLLISGISFYTIKQKQPWHLPILVSLIIIMCFDHWWWSLHYGQLLWWLLLAMMIKNIHFSDKQPLE